METNDFLIEKNSLKLYGRLASLIRPNEFVVAFVIINQMSMSKKKYIKLNRHVLAEACNMSPRNITRMTDRLNEFGLIQKRLIGDAEKNTASNFYKLNVSKAEELLKEIDYEMQDEQQTNENAAETVTLKEFKTNKTIKANKTNKAFKTFSEPLEDKETSENKNIANNTANSNSLIYSQVEKEKDSKEKEELERVQSSPNLAAVENFIENVKESFSRAKTEQELLTLKGKAALYLNNHKATYSRFEYNRLSSVINSEYSNALALIAAEAA